MCQTRLGNVLDNESAQTFLRLVHCSYFSLYTTWTWNVHKALTPLGTSSCTAVDVLPRERIGTVAETQRCTILSRSSLSSIFG